MIDNGKGDGKGVLCGYAEPDISWAQDFADRFTEEENPIPGTKVEVDHCPDLKLPPKRRNCWYIRFIPAVEKEARECGYLGWLFGRSPKKDMNSEGTKEKIISLFEKYGKKDYIREEVSQLEHALQEAQIAEENGEDADMILAALLHDIGHLLAYEDEGEEGNFKIIYTKFGLKKHESHGDEWLKRNGVRNPIPELVGSHVLSKRWLCRDEKYYEKLSEASKHTLRDQ